MFSFRVDVDDVEPTFLQNQVKAQAHNMDPKVIKSKIRSRNIQIDRGSCATMNRTWLPALLQ
jgi:hypothetical protein